MAAILLASCSTLAYDQRTGHEDDAGLAQITGHEKGVMVREGIKGGFEVIFNVMRVPEDMARDKDDYHLMVSIQKDGKVLHPLHVHSRVRHPNGTVDQADMTRVGNWYMARYNLSHEQGRHWITVQFDVSGTKYSTGIYFPENGF